MTTTPSEPEDLPVLAVREGITMTADGRILVDGELVTPGCHRLDLGQGPTAATLTVAGPQEEEEV